jgi:hypothetical protein
MATSTSAAGLIWPKRMLNPWAKNRASPSFRFGAMWLVVDALLLGVGQQDHDQVGLGGGVGDRAAPAARRPRPWPCDDEPSRRPTRTSTPESLRFSAWAWPCEP